MSKQQNQTQEWLANAKPIDSVFMQDNTVLLKRTVNAFGEITIEGKDYYVHSSLAGQSVLVNTVTLEAYQVFKISENEPAFKLSASKTITMSQLRNQTTTKEPNNG